MWYLISPILSSIGTILDYIGSERASTVFYLLSSFLVLLGIQKLLRRKKYNFPMKPQAQRTNDLAINPVDTVKHTLETINIYMKVGMKIMNWIKKNLGAIVSVLELIVAIAVHISGIIDLPEPWSMVITCIIYGIPVITAVLTSGFTSTEFQTAVDNLKNNLKSANRSNKEKLNLLKEQLATAQSTLDEVNTNLTKIELLRSIGAPYEANTFSLYQAQKRQLTETVTKIEEQIKICQNQK